MGAGVPAAGPVWRAPSPIIPPGASFVLPASPYAAIWRRLVANANELLSSVPFALTATGTAAVPPPVRRSARFGSLVVIWLARAAMKLWITRMVRATLLPVGEGGSIAVIVTSSVPPPPQAPGHVNVPLMATCRPAVVVATRLNVKVLVLHALIVNAASAGLGSVVQPGRELETSASRPTLLDAPFVNDAPWMPWYQPICTPPGGGVVPRAHVSAVVSKTALNVPTESCGQVAAETGETAPATIAIMNVAALRSATFRATPR